MCIGINSDVFVNKMLKIHKNRGYMAKKSLKKVQIVLIYSIILF